MICSGCGNKKAYVLETAYLEEVKVMRCDKCGSHVSTLYDVYFKNPYWDEHIGSEEFPGPKFISSRADKKYWMEKCNVREAGDRVHGATSFDKISNRHAMESLRRKS